MTGKDRIHVVIASGGTGGHFYPSLAIAEAFRDAGDQITMLLAGKHVEDQLKLAADRQLRALPVPACRLPGKNPIAVLTFLWRFGKAKRLARNWARKEKPDVILGMGSFASAPTCLGGVAAGVPLVLHEGNAWMGRANRWLSRYARAAATSLPLVPECPCRCPQIQTGMPLRKAIIEAAAHPEVPPEFWTESGLVPGNPTVLVFGGSLGAEAINTLLPQSLPSIGNDAKRLQFIHLTGSPHNDSIADAYRLAGARACVKRHDPNIERAYLAADLVVCRAGASSICELALFGKPAILIPLPTAAEDHQTANARSLAACGAAWMLPQDEAKPEMLADLLGDFLRSPGTWREIGQRIHEFARPDATERVVQVLRAHARPPQKQQ
ncbi:MAG: UDP-N-acetylglucosamine--N-acetylmuramyl-(pentapeptide) pyrophosphoryl-undecaprenol N-acetylglucosamine transferase [Lentisphaeria bacterium]|jgi:UDP-N-acetylglucosamine--N-acetylmuramyl-(pentapeptide) pyrophosphoryl-undecaprenol N-acetylglucosamine transferase|nr:UDP-N-acetylglucosamine--N-acetylmuramyl-(pentapeptide) pyrophosphoryl-undecaprenol N-acetylglucosamine transferase [Lentisphaeria bacterium]